MVRLQDYFKEDLDVIFHYKTTVNLEILDRYLGLLNLILQFIIFLYIIVFALIINSGYKDEEQSVGLIISNTAGSTFNLDSLTMNYGYLMDGADLIYPSFPSNYFFVPTLILATPHQKKGRCKNFDKPCTVNSNCTEAFDGVCVQGFCEELNWCPLSLPNTAYTKQYEILNMTNLLVWFKSTVVFSRLYPKIVHSNMDMNEPIIGENTFSIQELISKAGITIVPQNGVVLQVKYSWNCEGASDCNMELMASVRENIDPNEFFNYRNMKYNYYREGGIEYRDEYKMIGIGIIFNASGYVSTIQISAIILQVSMGLALLKVASFIVDFLVVYVMPERDEYRRYKYIQTDDFDLVENEKKKKKKYGDDSDDSF